MIKSLRVRNFKSYIDAEMKLSRVTFLIGANAAGKSNALDALRFLNWMGRGERLDDIETRLGAAPGQIRGTQIELFRQGESTFDFRIEVEETTAVFASTVPDFRVCGKCVRRVQQFFKGA